MSQIIANSIPVPLALGSGQIPASLPVGPCLKQDASRITVPVIVDWALYGANSATPVTVELDMTNLSSSQQIDYVRSCFIDNTFSPTTVYAYFPDTGFTVVCPPYSVVMSPVWTNGKKVRMYATGFTDLNIPVTTYIFSNLNYDALAMVPSLIVPAIPSIQSFGPNSKLGGGVFTQTFLGVATGPAQPSKKNLIVSYGKAGSTIDVTTATFQGNPMTLVRRQQANGTRGVVAIWRPTVQQPNLTAADVSISYSIAPASCAIFQLALFNAQASPSDAKSSNVANAQLTLTTPNPGVAIYTSINVQTTLPFTDQPIGILNDVSQVVFSGTGTDQIYCGLAYQQVTGNTLILTNNFTGTESGQLAASFI